MDLNYNEDCKQGDTVKYRITNIIGGSSNITDFNVINCYFLKYYSDDGMCKLYKIKEGVDEDFPFAYTLLHAPALLTEKSMEEIYM